MILLSFCVGFGLGIVLTGIVMTAGESEHALEDYHQGYLDGWHDAGGKE